ncbi:MAG: toxin-antitoxin system YwqK family antitoxin [Bacteroidota bacterium]|jgi:antitoxin component YwqK of YwqJK toxin-antitoxin module
MNRLLLVFIIFGMNIFVFSQDSINFTDALGRRQGVWKKVDKDGHKKYDGQFKDGIPVGEFRYYYADGKLKTVSLMSGEGKTARTVSYASNGRKIAEGKYTNEKKDSIWRYFSELDGVLLSEENFITGTRSGVFKTFYPNGNVTEVIHFREGRKDGEWVQYFDDGKLKFKGTYVNDEKEGPFAGYFHNGKISFSGAYKTGHMDGPWTFYEENGEVMRTDKYSEGAVVKEKNQ